MKLSLVKFVLLFDPTRTWARLYELEKEFANFLRSKGLEATNLDVSGTSEKWVYVRPMEEIVRAPEEKKPGRPISLKTQIERLKIGKESAKIRDFKKGRLVKSKGYLKKE